MRRLDSADEDAAFPVSASTQTQTRTQTLGFDEAEAYPRGDDFPPQEVCSRLFGRGFCCLWKGEGRGKEGFSTGMRERESTMAGWEGWKRWTKSAHGKKGERRSMLSDADFDSDSVDSGVATGLKPTGKPED